VKTDRAEQKKEIKKLAVKDVVSNPANPRVINRKAPKFLELLASVKQAGVIVPILTRPHPEQKGKFQLLAGERRWQAAQAAKCKEITAVVHHGLTDAEAFEITFTENYLREDLNPIEEGKAVDTLLERFKGDVAAVAAKLGRSTGWIRKRIQLTANLSKIWKKLIVEGTDNMFFANWTTAHFCEIAKFPQATQEIIGKELDTEQELITVKQLSGTLAEFFRILKKAPWPVEDKTLLPAAGSCGDCSKRSGKQPELWDDDKEEIEEGVCRVCGCTDAQACPGGCHWVEPDLCSVCKDKPAAKQKKIGKDDRCLDRNCWNKKRQAYIDRRKDSLQKEYENLKLVATEHIYYGELPEIEKKYPGMIEHQTFVMTNKENKIASPALVVYGKNVGELIWIKPSGTSRFSGKAKGTGQTKTLKQRRELLNAKRWAQVLVELRTEITLKNVSSKDIRGDDVHKILLALATIFGTIHREACPDGYHTGRGWDNFKKLAGLPLDKIQAELWVELLPVLESRLSYNGPITQTPPEYIDEAWRVGKLTGIDVGAIFKEVSERKGFTEPKSWASLKEDGTPKATKAKAVKKKTKTTTKTKVTQKPVTKKKTKK